MEFGLIGCGGIGTLRAKALESSPANELKAVCDVNEAAAKYLAGRVGCRVERNWRSLVTDDSIEAIIVSTPPDLHAEMCIEALNAGKHVLCEKPLARTPEECFEIVQTAQKTGHYLATGFNYRFYPSIEKARQLLDSGLIGDLDHIRSYAGYSAAEHSQDWLHDSTVMGGGALRDNGIHLIDLTCYFLGGVTQVKGLASNSVWNYAGCEDNGFALLRNETGKIASLQASWTEWRGYRLQLELYGAKGCIRASCFPMFTQINWFTEGGGLRKKAYHFPKTFIAEHLRSYRWVVIQSFIEEFSAFVTASRGDASEIASGFDGLQAVEIAQVASQNTEQEELESLHFSSKFWRLKNHSE